MWNMSNNHRWKILLFQKPEKNLSCYSKKYSQYNQMYQPNENLNRMYSDGDNIIIIIIVIGVLV